MMNNNKILTVSYGTFSCTLEGFEDSFDTMKAIAEYFRDLAADDRYFGAEPPQPDMDMLARIAEREVARRVEAHQSDTGIHLRTQQAGVAAVTAGAALAPKADPVAQDNSGEARAETSLDDVPLDDAPLDEAPVDTAELAATDAVVDQQPAPIPTPPSHFTPPVADDVTSSAAPTDQPTELEEPTEAAEEMVEAEDLISAVVQDAEPDVEDDGATEMDAPEEPIMHASMEHMMPGMDADLPTPPEESVLADPDDYEVEDVIEPAPEPNSIADKLARIRDVVAKNQSSPSGYSEDQHAEEFMKGADDESFEDALMDEDDSTALSIADTLSQDALASDDAEDHDIDAIAEAIADAETDVPETALTSEETYDAEFEEDDSLFAETLAEIENLNIEESSDTIADSTDDEIEDLMADDGDEDGDDLGAEILRLTEEYEADDEELLPEDIEDTDEETFATQGEIAEELTLNDEDFAGLLDDGVSLDEESEETSEIVEAAEVVTTETNVRRVRVIKVKRDDLDTALSDGSLEEVDADDLDEEFSSLSMSDEEELLRELAEVEAELEDELADADDLPEQDESADIDAAADASAARLLQEVAGAEEDELDRLMAEADSQMDEPEGTSRRSAFNHLRAAVAATKADDKLSEVAGAPKDDEYRTDLAAAVKPRRPVKNAEGRKDRPGNERPAPLKLVAEQRIDIPDTNTGPVQPRRVSADMQSGQDDNGNFADYAESCGAHELSDVLEAAASYLSFVEGREQFSRPQLMTKVRQLGLEGFTREDGLRHFGQLLRAGKIEKIKGGRFTVSEDIGFRPDDHRQAG